MKTILLNSALALSSAFIFTIVLHELAHYATALIMGYEAIIFHNRVVYEMLTSPEDELGIAAAGPVFSLVQGMLAFHLVKRFPPNGFSLWLLWMGIAGILTFMGYLMIAPFIPVGDTGKVFSILGVPHMIQLGLAIFAAIALTIIFISSARLFEPFVGEDLEGDKRKKARWARNMIMFPLFIGLILVTLLQFPLTHFISLLGTIFPPFSIMVIFGAFMVRKLSFSSFQTTSKIHLHVSVFLVVLTVLGIVLNRWMAMGISFIL